MKVTNTFSLLLCLVMFIASAFRLHAQRIQPPIAIPDESAINNDPANLSLKKELDQRYQILKQRFENWNAQATAYNAQYGGRDFKDGSTEAAAGITEQSRLSKSLKSYERDSSLFTADVARLHLKKIASTASPSLTDTATGDVDPCPEKKVADIIDAMNALARRLGWSEEKLTRLDASLKKLDFDGDPDATPKDIQHAWQDVVSRGADSTIAREAANGRGPGFAGAGKQTNLNDCAIFALANAADLPYGVAAARATDLIRQGEWRDAAERANPQKAIEKHGLMGGEVLLLAEAFGQAEVVNGTDFAKTLKEGRPIMLNVVPSRGQGAHEVVLTKTFQHNGSTWYEMMESTRGPERRLYLSAKELSIMQQENGVAFRPNPRKTPKLLRESGAE